MDKIDRVINYFRNLREEGMVVGTGGFTGSADPKGPVAGFDPVMGCTRRKKVIGLGKNSRNRWKPTKK